MKPSSPKFHLHSIETAKDYSSGMNIQQNSFISTPSYCRTYVRYNWKIYVRSRIRTRNYASPAIILESFSLRPVELANTLLAHIESSANSRMAYIKFAKKRCLKFKQFEKIEKFSQQIKSIANCYAHLNATLRAFISRNS